MSCLMMYVSSWISIDLSSNKDFLFATEREHEKILLEYLPIKLDFTIGLLTMHNTKQKSNPHIYSRINIWSLPWNWALQFNPILTGGGQFDPPLHEIRDCVATAVDRDAPFHDFFLSSLTHLLIPSSRGHATFCTRTSAQNLPKIHILHMFVYKTHGNYWFS